MAKALTTREIMDILDPGSLPYHFRIFGKKNLANYEGMCLGPKQDGSRQCIILVADSQNRAGNAFYHLKDYVKALDFRP